MLDDRCIRGMPTDGKRFFLGQPNLSGLATAPAFPRFYAGKV